MTVVLKGATLENDQVDEMEKNKEGKKIECTYCGNSKGRQQQQVDKGNRTV